jgi:Sodium:sulfate symporter transmembrane region
MGCLSTYGIGSAPPYFAAGYVPQSKWYQLGFIMSVWYLAVWLIAGGAWWKVCLGVICVAGQLHVLNCWWSWYTLCICVQLLICRAVHARR